MTTLDSFRDRLAKVIAGLDKTQSLTIARTGSMDFVSEDGSNRLVQFVLFGTDLRVESFGDQYLSDVDALTPDQHAALSELGWSPPDESGNYWAAWADPVPYEAVASMALATLASVHGVEHAEQLSFSGSPGVLESFSAGADAADDRSTYSQDVTQTGCDSCRQALGTLYNEGLEKLGDVKDSFRSVDGYSSAQLLGCPHCRTLWLEAYIEDFTDVPIEAEWGDRTWIYRPLSAYEVARIYAARGTRGLDLRDFADRRPTSRGE